MRRKNAVLLGDCEEHLAALQDRDRSHLRLIVFFHNDYFGGAVHLEFHGCAVQHIALRTADGLLDQLIFAVAKRFGQAQASRVIRIEDINIHRSGVVDPLGDELAALQVTDLKADTGGGNHLAGCGVLLHHIDQGGDGRIVDDIAVNIRMSLDIDLKGGQQLRTFFAGDLFYDIGAVGQVFGDAETVLINGNEVTLRFIGGIIGAGRFEPDLKLCARFRRFDLRVAIVRMLYQHDIAFNGCFIYIHCQRVIFDGILFGIGAYRVDRIIQQIAFARCDLTDRPAAFAGEIVSQDISVFIGRVGLHQLAVLIHAVNSALKRSVSAGVTVGIAEIFRAFIFVIIGCHQLRHG